MDTMKMPGFTSEASLYRGSSPHFASGFSDQTEQGVYPADYIDQACLGRCKKNCTIACTGTTGSEKSLCIHECAHENAGCNASCRRSGSPPSPTCPPGTSRCGATCNNLTSDPLNCGACGASCSPGTVCCGGTCANLSNDPLNCGSCGVKCSQCCYGGSCGVTTVCPISGPGSCCPSAFPVCRNFFGNEFCSLF